MGHVISKIVYRKVLVLPDGRVSRADAARYLGISSKTLANWACQEMGPRSQKLGNRVFYMLPELDRFIYEGCEYEMYPADASSIPLIVAPR